MKNIIVTSILIICFSSSASRIFCQGGNVDLTALQLTIKGEVVGLEGKLKTYDLNVMEHGKIIYTYHVENGKFRYTVPYNSDVMIEVVADGYYSKRIAVSSNSKARIGDGPVLSLQMSVLSKKMYPQLAAVEDMLDFPSAFVTYDRAGVHYDKNEAFSKVINDEIVKLLPNVNYSDSKLAVIDW